MTIEERATEWAKSVSPWETIYDESRKMDYMLGATEQKKIDEDELHAAMECEYMKALEKEKKRFVEKACEWIMTTPMYAKQPSQLVEEFKKAMKE